MQQSSVLSLIALILFGIVPGAASTASTAGSGSPQQTSRVLQPVFTNSFITVGQNQLAFGLLLNHRTLVANAVDVVVRLYPRDDQPPALRPEVRAFYQAFDSAERIARAADVDEVLPCEWEGVYVARVLFDRPGIWVLEIFMPQDGELLEVSRSTIEVLAVPPAPVLRTSAQP